MNLSCWPSRCCQLKYATATGDLDRWEWPKERMTEIGVVCRSLILLVIIARGYFHRSTVSSINRTHQPPTTLNKTDKAVNNVMNNYELQYCLQIWVRSCSYFSTSWDVCFLFLIVFHLLQIFDEKLSSDQQRKRCWPFCYVPATGSCFSVIWWAGGFGVARRCLRVSHI